MFLMGAISKVFKSLVNGPVWVILFGLVFFGIGGGLAFRQISFERQGVQVQGEVTGLSQNCDDEGCSYSPVVRFQTQDGQTITFVSIHSSSPPAYETGEKVTVIHAIDDPEKAIIKGGGMVFQIIFMVIGGPIIILGLFFFYYNVRNSFLAE
jgi:hypothetical protein